jgi:hypothetical protein
MNVETLIDQTLTERHMIVKLLKSIPVEQADTMPPTWKNSARWHAGHLIVTPALLVFGILREPLTVPEEYRKWFAKGTSPADWGNDPIPSYEDLCDDIVPVIGRLYEAIKPRITRPFLEPYTTTQGVVLRAPEESFSFNMFHDGIHLGMLLALKRGLG